MITFEPFREWYNQQMDGSRKKRRLDLLNECNMSPTTAQKIWSDKLPVRTDVIDKLCDVYGLRVDQVIKFVKEETPR